jgi:uncharacterized repeat protein (TIGR01451 family)
MSAHRRSAASAAAVVSVILAAILVPLLQSAPAGAHHAEVRAAVNCDGVVSFTASAWDAVAEGWADDPVLARTNPNVLVWLEVDGVTVATRTGSFAPDNGFSFGGTFEWPAGASTAVVWAQEQSNWANGIGPGSPRTAGLRAPGDCGANPALSSKWECVDGEGTIVVTFTNDNGPFGSPVDFVVTSPIADTVTVTSGGSEQRVYGPFPDGSQTVVITANGVDLSQTQTIDCDQPAPSASYKYECVNGDGLVVFTLVNAGTEATTFAVTFNGAASNVDVGAGETKPLTFDGIADGSYAAIVTANGQTLVDEPIVVDCKQAVPKADVSYECVDGDGAVVFSLTNSGTEDATFTIAFNGQTRDVPVAAGGAETVTYPDVPDGNYPTVVSAGGAVVADTHVKVRCDNPGKPDVSLATDCADNDGTATLTLKNIGGELPLTFVVNGAKVDVAPNTSQTVTFTGYTDGVRVITVTVEGVDGNFDQTVTTKCDKPSTASFVPRCVDGDGVVEITLTNNGDDAPAVFTINGEQRTVQPMSTTTVNAGPYPDGPASITYQINGEPADAAKYTFTVSCDRPGKGDASIEAKCLGGVGEVTITLRNTEGDLPVTFTVNGAEHKVPAGGSKTVVVPDVADGPYQPTILIDGKPLELVTEVDCDLPVLGATAICDEVQSDGSTIIYWFNLRNPEATPVDVTWNGGSSTLAAGETKRVAAASAPLIVKYGDDTVLEAPASGDECATDVVITKQVQGPSSGRTYTIRISQLVDGTYFEELTFELQAGASKTISLPSSLGGEGIPYKVEEVDDGGAQVTSVTPNRFVLDGHKAETVSVVITNSFASVSIDKTVSSAEALPGEDLTYTLAVSNTGGLTLKNVVVSDRLPKELTFKSLTITGGAGTCALAEPLKPQLLMCSLDGNIAPGSAGPTLTIVATVDPATQPDTNLQNQAKVQGQYINPNAGSAVSRLGDMQSRAGAMSCVPGVSETVCDLSAAVGSVVRQTRVLPPTPTVVGGPPIAAPPSTQVASAPPAPGRSLPRTGANGTQALLGVAMALVAAGSLLTIVRRRPRRV